jgi:hypothetical protein
MPDGLDEVVQVVRQPIGEVLDRHLSAAFDVAVERLAIIDEDLGHLDVEVPRQVRPVGEPALRLLRQAVDQDQWRPPLVIIEHPRQVEPFADVGRHGCDTFLVAAHRMAESGRRRGSPHPGGRAIPRILAWVATSTNETTETSSEIQASLTGPSCGIQRPNRAFRPP